MTLLSYLFWDPSRSVVPWNIPLLDRPILWYGVFFALGFFLAYFVFLSLFREFLHPYRVSKKEIGKLTERLSVYVIIGTLLGARLGDVIFYQSPLDYLNDPLGIFKFWEGGLSSHGGVLGILISLWVFSLRIRKTYPMLTWIATLDLLSIPALLAGGFIRVGNFFNQEILGMGTSVPWAIVFGHPADGSSPIPRHPVQLYEALFYFVFFGVLWILRKKVPKMFRLGKTSGLFFMVMFGFRFLIEFLKVPQSFLVPKDAFLSMGQILSIPFILLGVILFFNDKRLLRAHTIKRH